MTRKYGLYRDQQPTSWIRRYILYTREPPWPLKTTREQQAREIRHYADSKRPGWIMRDEIHDEDTSDLLRRKGLSRAVALSRETGAVLIAHSIPFFTRRIESLVDLHKRIMSQGEGDYAVATGPRWDSITPEGRQLQAWLAKVVAMARSSRVRISRKRYSLRAEPQPYLGGVVPYGFQLDENDPRWVTPNAHEQFLIHQILRMRTEGRSYEDIAQHLNDENMPPRLGIWHRQQVARVVKRWTVIDKETQNV